MTNDQVNDKGTAVLPREKDHEAKKQEWGFHYEGRLYTVPMEHITILEIKKLVGQEPEVAIAEIVDGKQVERPNDFVVHLAKSPSFKRVPEFVRG